MKTPASDRVVRALYLTYDGLTDPLGQSQILPYILLLSKKGFQFTIVSFEKKDRYQKYHSEINRLCSNHGITWIPLTYYRFPPVVSTVYNLFILRIRVAALHRVQKFSTVHCRSYLTAIIGLWLRKHAGVKMIFDMRGFWADERVEGGIWNLRNPLYAWIYNFFKRKEKQFLEHADAVISLTHSAAEYLINTLGVSEKKITVIACSVDLDLFNPDRIDIIEKNKLRADLGIAPDDFVLIYLGSLGTWYLYEEMVKCFEQLKEVKKQAKFLFVTPDLESVEKRPDFLATTVGRASVPLHCSIADAAVFFIKPTFSKKASSATKLAELMALGIPIITNPGWGDVELMVARGAKIILYDENWLQKLENLSNFSDNKEYVLNLSLTFAANQYADVYDDLLKGKDESI
jgi:glycosyltransferase involved in cell wall biosynthesis